LQRHGKYAEAIEQLEGARRVLETTLGLEHPVTTVARGSLARAIAGSSGRREDTGAVVGRVPADETRLELGDWIVRYDGRSIDDPDALLELMDETEGRRAVAVEIVRKHQRLKLRVQGGRLELELWD
jgi:S1-C subfamily serine protease